MFRQKRKEEDSTGINEEKKNIRFQRICETQFNEKKTREDKKIASVKKKVF